MPALYTRATFISFIAIGKHVYLLTNVYEYANLCTIKVNKVLMRCRGILITYLPATTTEHLFGEVSEMSGIIEGVFK